MFKSARLYKVALARVRLLRNFRGGPSWPPRRAFSWDQTPHNPCARCARPAMRDEAEIFTELPIVMKLKFRGDRKMLRAFSLGCFTSGGTVVRAPHRMRTSRSGKVPILSVSLMPSRDNVLSAARFLFFCGRIFRGAGRGGAISAATYSSPTKPTVAGPQRRWPRTSAADGRIRNRAQFQRPGSVRGPGKSDAARLRIFLTLVCRPASSTTSCWRSGAYNR